MCVCVCLCVRVCVCVAIHNGITLRSLYRKVQCNVLYKAASLSHIMCIRACTCVPSVKSLW